MNPVQENLPQPQQLPEIEAPHEKLLRAPTLAEKLSQGKFKFFLILIAIFLVVDAGIYLALISNKPKEAASKGNKTQVMVPPSSPTPTIEPTPITFPILQPKSTARWITYSNKAARLTLKYPFTYFVVKDPSPDEESYELMFADSSMLKQDLEKCMLPSSNETECNRFNLAIQIETYSKPEDQSLSDFLKQKDTNDGEDGNISQYNPALISGFPALIYEGPGLGIGHYTYIDKGGIVVSISAFAFDEENMKAYKQILSTVQFLDKPVSSEGKMCGGIAAIQCSVGYSCNLDGDFPDAGGKCEKITSSSPSSAPLPSREAEQVFCTQDIKVCSDGSYVSRGGPNCEFKACPATKSNKSMKSSIEDEDDD